MCVAVPGAAGAGGQAFGHSSKEPFLQASVVTHAIVLVSVKIRDFYLVHPDIQQVAHQIAD